MILKALTLENFKGIREPVRVEFAPLTLLFGPNNAGKSTVVQALMYAREVMERNNCDPGQTQMGGDVIDLGGFENIVYGHDRMRPIRMRFELDLRGQSLPDYSDWVRDMEIDPSYWNTYTDALQQLDVPSIKFVRSRLLDVWVEIKIAWCSDQGGPLVQSYSVGSGPNPYAVITYDENQNQALLSYFNFGAHPFGTRYMRTDETEFDYIFARETRNFIRNYIENNDVPSIGLKKGRRIAMLSKHSGTSDEETSRDWFDRLVSTIVQGDGKWGDSTIDEKTGEQNKNYEQRQLLIKLAGLSAPLPTEKSDDEDPKDDCWEDRLERFSSPSIGDDELDSWLLDIFVALIRDGHVPRTSDCALPLKLRGSALPELKQTLEIDSRYWLPEEQQELMEYPAFAQEYIHDLLSTIIAGPGALLLDVLRSAIYVSPLRKMPPRHYQPARSPESRRWANGLAAWDWLLLKDKRFAAAVNDWLVPKNRFNSGYAVDLCQYRELEVDSPLMELIRGESLSELSIDWLREQLQVLPEGRRLQIRDLRSGISLSPQDLGVGISQLVPVIVAALHSTSGVVAIEEPESNIHPAFQVVLADLFITQAKANPDVLFLVETHSEHLMLRCLRRIRESSEGEAVEGEPTLKPEEIAVHFVEPGDCGPSIHRIRIDADGDFADPWPRGFFRERFKELYGDDL